jgi:hypothetical protein
VQRQGMGISEISECFETPLYYGKLHSESRGARKKSEASLRIRHIASAPIAAWYE